MIAEILAGGQLQPSKGWFARGKSLARFSWDAVSARLDRNGDHSIQSAEWVGSPKDFSRLDRDHDGRLTDDDFKFSHNAQEVSRSLVIMAMADRDGDGRIKDTEYSRMIFQASIDQYARLANFADAVAEVEKCYADSIKEGLPYLSVADFRCIVDMTARARGHMKIPNIDGNIEVGSQSTLLRALGNRDIGVLRAGPSLGKRVPDFSLPTADGRGRVSLTSLLGKRPVVLIFGNATSPGFRLEGGSLEKLYQRERGRAEFLMIYGREEHPSDGWVARSNVRLKVAEVQPTTDSQRAAVAERWHQKLGLTIPMVVDGVDDRVGILYSGLPTRLYLLDAQGTVAYKSGRGPFGFKPDELEQSLLLLLQAEAETLTNPADSAKPRSQAGVRPAATTVP